MPSFACESRDYLYPRNLAVRDCDADLVRLRFAAPQLLIAVVIALTTGHLWVLLLPLFTVLALIFQTVKRIEEEDLRELSGRIWLGNRRLGRFPWLWQSAVRERVLLTALRPPDSQLGADFEHELLRKLSPALVGISPQGHPVRLDSLEQFGHAIIIGATGSGKTALLRLLICQLDCEYWLADYKGGVGLAEFTNCRLFTTNLANDRNQFWVAAGVELARREQLAAKSIALDKMFLVIDELAAAIAEPDAQRTINSIARKGRGLSMHLVAATQNLSGIPRAIWTNMQTRILLSPADASDALQIGVDSKLLNSLGAHGGVLRSPQYSRAFWFQPVVSVRQDTAQRQQTNPLLDFSGEVSQDL